MKNKKILTIIAIVVVVIVVAIAGIFAYNEQNKAKQLKILNEEAEKLSKLDLSEDEIDMEIKTTGKYAIVEETMKNYLNEIKITMTGLIDLYNNSELDNTLSSDNITNDAPDFVQTKEKLSALKTQLNEYIEKCDNLLNAENVENAINDKGVSDYYKKLYVNLMLDEETKENLEKERAELKDSIEEVNETVEGLEKIIDFLVDNKSDWTVSDGKIQFTSVTKLREYYQILNEM